MKEIERILNEIDIKVKRKLKAVSFLEKEIKKFTSKWYIYYLSDIVILGVIIALFCFFGIDITVELKNLLGGIGLGSVSGAFEIQKLVNKVKERHKWSNIPEALSACPNKLRGMLMNSDDDDDIELYQTAYDQIQLALNRLIFDENKEALELLRSALNIINQ